MDRENHRHEDGHQVKDVSNERDSCIEVKADVEEANDRNDKPVEDHGTHAASSISEGSVDGDDSDIDSGSPGIIGPMESEITEGTTDDWNTMLDAQALKTWSRGIFKAKT